MLGEDQLSARSRSDQHERSVKDGAATGAATGLQLAKGELMFLGTSLHSLLHFIGQAQAHLVARRGTEDYRFMRDGPGLSNRNPESPPSLY